VGGFVWAGVTTVSFISANTSSSYQTATSKTGKRRYFILTNLSYPKGVYFSFFFTLSSMDAPHFL